MSYAIEKEAVNKRDTNMTTIYKKHEIIRTDWTAQARPGRPASRLYKINLPGVTSPADVASAGDAYRLGLTSIAACKRHITTALAALEVEG